MDPGWFVLFCFMLVEAILVLLLVMPMPSNQVRGAIVTAITSVWDKNAAVRYVAFGLTVINALYFWSVVDALIHPSFKLAFGFVADEALLSCEMRANEYERERNAYISVNSLFLFLVLRRLVDIQLKLHEARAEAKNIGVPVGQPVPPMGKKVN